MYELFQSFKTNRHTDKVYAIKSYEPSKMERAEKKPDRGKEARVGKAAL